VLQTSTSELAEDIQSVFAGLHTSKKTGSPDG